MFIQIFIQNPILPLLVVVLIHSLCLYGRDSIGMLMLYFYPNVHTVTLG